MIPCALAEPDREALRLAKLAKVPEALLSADHVDRPGLVKLLEAELGKAQAIEKKFSASSGTEREIIAESMRKMSYVLDLVQLIGYLKVYEATPILLRHHDTWNQNWTKSINPRACGFVLGEFGDNATPYLLRAIESNPSAEQRKIAAYQMSLQFYSENVPKAVWLKRYADMLREKCDVHNPYVIEVLQSLKGPAKTAPIELPPSDRAKANHAENEKSSTQPKLQALDASRKSGRSSWWALLAGSVALLGLVMWFWNRRSPRK